jgi:cytochrome c556
MQMYSRMLVAGTFLLALGAWSVAAGNHNPADEAAGLSGEVQKVADALDKGDTEQAKKLAADVAKSHDDLGDIMSLMQIRRANSKKPVFGIGAKAGAMTPDGIEAKIIALSKKVDARQLDKESMALVEMANRVQAIAEVANAKAPEKDEGQKKKKDWLEWTSEMEKAAKALGDAAKEKKAPAVKSAAVKLNSTCNNCHGVFRD